MVVIGGRGFIGTNLIEKYQGSSFDIVDDQDILNKHAVSNINDDIIHLAAIPGIQECIEHPSNAFDVNVRGTINLLESVRFSGKKLIFASSAACENINNPYAASKRACELFLQAYNEAYGIKTISLRFSNIYGPHSMHKNSVIAKMCKDALTGGTITVYGNPTRDFIHVSDICEAIIKAIRSGFTGILDVGTGIGTSINDIAEIIQKKTSCMIEYKKGRENEAEQSILSINETAQILEWEPKISVIDGVEETLEWFRNNL